MFEIIKQETGRFDRRFGIGPANWPYFDLLWIHTGAVALRIGAGGDQISLQAPAGVLIFPNVPFSGRAQGDSADASVSHFRGGPFQGMSQQSGYLICDPERDTLALQAMVNLSQAYASRAEPLDVRLRLLTAILDGFRPVADGGKETDPLEILWAKAAGKLENIRGLADVAALVGLSESTLRARHRALYGRSAGRHLQNLRLETADRLLATTGMTVREIACAVGYAHPESFSAAYKRSRNRTPLAHRRLCQRLA